MKNYQQVQKPNFPHSVFIFLIPILLFCSSSYSQVEQHLADSVVTRTESMFPGNRDSWMLYLIRTLHYPKEAMDQNIQGSIIVKFTVDEKGRLKNIDALTGPKELREEAIRVIRQSGRWIPARENGKAVSSEKEQVITFKREFPQEVQPKMIGYTGSDTSVVEIESSYPGGPAGWMRYLNRSFRYPEWAVRNGIQGTVVVQFIVDKDGSVSELEAISGPTEGGLREHVIQIIRKSGKWLPATRNGEPLKSYKKQAITFSLQG